MKAGTRTQTEALLIRFEPDHLKLVSEAASYLGLPKSSWIRTTVLREAREVLAGKPGERREGEGRRVTSR
jgi:uncharacterized protein (DUF1778 family)